MRHVKSQTPAGLTSALSVQLPSKPNSVHLACPNCSHHVLPFEAQFIDALGLRRVSDVSEFHRVVSTAFDQLSNSKGCLERNKLELLIRDKINSSCPSKCSRKAADSLVKKLGASRKEFVASLETMVDTLDRRVWPIATSQFFSALMFAVSQPLMPLLVKELGISMLQFGGTVAVMPLIRVLVSCPATFVSNTFGRKPLTVEGQLIAAVGMSVSAFVANSWQLALSRCIIGVGTSCASVGQQNMLADIATGRTRSRIFAPGSMRANAAFAIGPSIGGYLAAAAGVQPAFMFLGAGMAAVSIRNRYMLNETLLKPSDKLQNSSRGTNALGGTSSSEWWTTFVGLAKDPALRTVTLANAGFNFTSISSRYVLLPMLALNHWDLGAAGLGLAIGAMSSVQFAAAKPTAYIADMYGRKTALLPGLALTSAAMALAASGEATTTAISLVLGGWALGSSLVGSVPLALTLDAAGRLNLNQQETARALAITRMMGDMGMTAGCLTSGYLLSILDAPTSVGIQSGILGAVTVGTGVALCRNVDARKSIGLLAVLLAAATVAAAGTTTALCDGSESDCNNYLLDDSTFVDENGYVR